MLIFHNNTNISENFKNNIGLSDGEKELIANIRSGIHTG
jgi:hypothetical protein